MLKRKLKTGRKRSSVRKVKILEGWSGKAPPETEFVQRPEGGEGERQMVT